MEKMPFQLYGNYFLLEPFISGYFELGELEKALQLWEQVAEKYRENLCYYSRWSRQRQLENMDVILTEIQMYRSLVDLLLKHGEETLVRQKVEDYSTLVKKFPLLSS